MKNNFNSIINSNPIVLVDFFADWCGPCKMLGKILKEVKEELGETIKIVKINVDKNPISANTYQVKGLPTMLLFKKGKQVWRHSGLLQKQDLIHAVKNHM